MATDLFPTFLKLANRRVVVVGGGPVGRRNWQGCWRPAPTSSSWLRTSCLPSSSRARGMSGADSCLPILYEAWFVVAAAPPDVNREVAAAAAARRLFVNAVDDPASASVYLGGIVRKGGVTVAI